MRDPVLGLGGSNHDFSAAIVDSGTIRVAIEDERLQRVKQAQTEWHAHPARDAAESWRRLLGRARAVGPK